MGPLELKKSGSNEGEERSDQKDRNRNAINDLRELSASYAGIS
jgi:hypothetical protein